MNAKTRILCRSGGLLASLLLCCAAQAQQYYLGEILCGGWNFAPRGTAIAAGQLLPINQNQALFALLGTQYGGNGQTTFALPDLRGRTIIDAGQGPGLSNYDQGIPGGTQTATLLVSQLPPHRHQVSPGGSSSDATLISPAAAVPAAKGRTTYFAAPTAGASLAPNLTEPTGSGQPFSTMQPYQTINCFIALVGIFPSRD